ncbi:MAG TPA: hypothetical protein VF669_17655 [Tepidisphaeraceae bacterium]|jgi:hypothetical protein
MHPTTANPALSQTADTGAAILVEHPSDNSVIIRLTYPPDQRQRDLKLLLLICLCLCLIPTATWFLFRSSTASGFALATSTLAVAYLISCLVRQFRAHTRSCILQAGPTGFTIQTSPGKPTTTKHFSQDQIRDITIRFSHYTGPRSLFRGWLEIKTTTHRTIRCLHDIGGNHLAQIATTLRAALNLPPRPSP